MKKLHIKAFLYIVCAAILSLAVTATSVSRAYADTYRIDDEAVYENDCIVKQDNEDFAKEEECFCPDFSERTISNCEFLYSLDGNADFIYEEFYEGGYAIYANETMEMMEYSFQSSPYEGISDTKYYAGPENYLCKADGMFYSIESGETFELDENETKWISDGIRATIINPDVKKYDISQSDINKNLVAQDENTGADPGLDKKNLPYTEILDGTFIANYRYFLAAPTIGDNYENKTYGKYNNSGTCGPIAAQLILGFNNYYNDRRIIEDRFLNGYSDKKNIVTDEESNPNYCSDPMTLNSDTAGTRSESNNDNSFFCEMIYRTMDPYEDGTTLSKLKAGISGFLSERIPSDSYSVTSRTASSAISSSYIMDEIDSGRPIIIRMDKDLGASNHFVVGYGYQDYTYEDGSGTYDGYVVHFGWQKSDGKDHTCVWVNSSWCDSYIAVDINHTHDYSAVGTISGTDRTEYKCSICEQRTDAAINMSASSRYEERKATLYQNDELIYRDFYVTFETAGNKLFQTFGGENTELFLYDDDYNLLAYVEDGGHDYNALFSYTVNANTPYILRTQISYLEESGVVKVAITPSDTEYDDYYRIDTPLGYHNFSVSTELSLNATAVYVFRPQQSGNFTFELSSTFDNFLYVINPRSTDLLLESVDYNDDGGTGYNAKLTRNLSRGTSYFIIISAYNPSTMPGSASDPSISLSVTVNGDEQIAPEYLSFELVSRSGFLVYDWGVNIINPNPYEVQVTYNSKMCFESDAKDYSGLKHLVTTIIPANSFITVEIDGNGTAGWITACINYEIDSVYYRAITCVNGLSGKLTTNTPTNLTVVREY